MRFLNLGKAFEKRLRAVQDTRKSIMSTEHWCLVKVDSEPWQTSCVTLDNDQEVLQIRSSESWSLVKTVKGEDVIGLIGGDTTDNEEKLSLIACVRDGEFRRLLRIQFEGAQVGLLQDQISKQETFQVRKRKKLLVLVNPVGGRGRAVEIWQQVEDILVEVGISCEVVITTHAGHARELVSSCEIGNYGGVVTVSGDGGLHEVLNGLSGRLDWNEIHQLDGPFHNVYAIKQPWIDYSTFFCPQAKASEGKMWLVVIKGSMGRAGLLRWALNTENAAHLQPEDSLCIPIKAFRFVPLSPGPNCPMTVDAERLPGATVQGRIKKAGCNIMVK